MFLTMEFALPLITLTPPSAEQAEKQEINFGVIKPSLWLSAPSWAVSLILFLAIYLLQARYPQWASLFISSIQPFVGSFMGAETLRATVILVLMVIITFSPMKMTVRLLATNYYVSSRQLRHHAGISPRIYDQIEMAHVRDIAAIVPLWLLPLSIGHVYLHTVDRSHPLLVIVGVKNPKEFKALLDELRVLDRDRRGYREVEYTNSEID
jgi:hypothetical protein